ncbi:preprotein translocase subunit YajC [Frankia sp. CNm7]|uniref:Preprotein translocase subunit YajC n=1 Tax=Frankia nepalensis TaxID=1836974 RepID=A0A937RGG6_9ACTN|nr:preprotein translocase subunit YajC [Frankia nepalensis]MBL7494751.1 preprotein translocase subunit YajC [Frankia nepalensis]MBL7514028.1 preprotein translocase subunit YajC [Frankia nepalensis]MBL7524644.1 preprotein translocase subunit YajC [Frankia nepalensis]MBL7629960.1 preprotein translocase subunit YajC [Frankia nepalensis]
MHEIATAAIVAGDQAADDGGGGASSWLLPLLILLVGVYFFVIQRRRSKAAQQEQSQIGPGTLVMTRSGMYGTVVEIDGQDVLLEIAPDVVVRYTRAAVGRVVNAPPTEVEEETEDGPVDEPASQGTAPKADEEPADAESPQLKKKKEL